MFFKQSEATAANATVNIVILQSDGISAYTSTFAAGDIKLSKAGAAFGNIGGTPAHLEDGVWKIPLSSTDTDTVGDLTIKVKKTGVLTTVVKLGTVIPANVYDGVRFGLTALPNAAAEAAGGLYTRGTGAGQLNQDANGRVDANVKTWIGGTIPAVNVTGVPKVDVVDWLGSAPDALSSGKLPADVKLWLTAAPAALSASGYVQSMLERWLTDDAAGTPTALSSNKVPADVKLWLAAAPAALSTNGYVQSMLLRWLTDNAAGTPDALISGDVDANVGGYQTGQAPLQPSVAGRTLNVAADGVADADLQRWLGTAPDALSSGKVASDLKLWLAAAPVALSTNGYVSAMVLRWLTDNAAGTPDALSSGKVASDMKLWLATAPASLTTNGYAKTAVLRWLTDDAPGTPDALSSNKVPADIKLWLTAAPAALSTNGYVSAMLLRWLTDNAAGTPDALISGDVDANVGGYQTGQAPLQPTTAGRTLNVDASGYGDADVQLWKGILPDSLSSGKLPSDVKLWLTAAPAALSTSGYVQTMLLRWLTDNAAGTPDALISGDVDANVGGYQSGSSPLQPTVAGRTLNVDASGNADADVQLWRAVQPDALSSGKVPADLKLWLASAPASLSTNGYVQSMLLRWLTDNAAGTPDALISGDVDASVGDLQAGALTAVAGAVWDLATSGHATAGSFGELAAVIAGLHHQNTVMDKTIYNGNKFMTSSRVRVFATKAATLAANPGGVESANGADGEIYRFLVTGVEESIPGEVKFFTMVRDL